VPLTPVVGIRTDADTQQPHDLPASIPLTM
jgi:hypothetical protein